MGHSRGSMVTTMSRDDQEIHESDHIVSDLGDETEEEYFVGSEMVRASRKLRRVCGACVCICWLVGLYLVYMVPDERGRRMVDCVGATANVTMRYGPRGDGMSHSVFGIWSTVGSAGDGELPYDATPFLLTGVQPDTACHRVNVTMPDVETPRDTGLVALVARGGCSFEQKMQHLTSAGIQLMLEYDRIHDGSCAIMNSENGVDHMDGTPSPLTGVVSVTSRAAYDFVAPYVPHEPAFGDSSTIRGNNSYAIVEISRARKRHELILGVFDLSELMLVVFAVGSIAMGSWCALVYDGQAVTGQYGTEKHGEDDSVHVLSMTNAVSFVWVASGMLLVLFFLSSSILASVFALVFALAGWESGYLTLSLILSRTAQRMHVQRCLWTLHHASYMSDCISLVVSTMVAGSWLLGRHEWFWYIGQDILAFFLLLSIFCLVRLSSLKIVVVLLGFALVYDAFWVFIQPKLTGSTSIMVDVVEGLSLPLFIAFPQFSTVGSAIQYSVLGLGDIALPGMCIVFAAWVSNQSGTISYFLSTLVAYVAGLLLCFIALAYNVGGQEGQPALVYVVPCILTTFLGCAWYQGSLKPLWTGGEMLQRSLAPLNSDEDVLNDHLDPLLP